MKSRILAGAACVALCASTAAAQVCQGDLSFRGSAHVAGALGVSNNTTAFGGGMTFGQPRGFFGGGSLGMLNFDQLNGTGLVLGGGLGYSMPLQDRSPWQICPGGTLSLDFGPSETVGGTTAHFSQQTFTLGASIGRAFPLTKSVNLLPFGSVAFGHTIAHASVAGLGGGSASDSYLLLGFGAGFQLSPSLVLKPQLSLAAGADLVDDTVFSLGVSWALPR